VRILGGGLGNRSIETRHAVRFEITLATALDLLGEPRTEMLGRKLHRLEPHPVRDIFPADDEVIAPHIFAADQEV
jgi:hypothetical protein